MTATRSRALEATLTALEAGLETPAFQDRFPDVALELRAFLGSRSLPAKAGPWSHIVRWIARGGEPPGQEQAPPEPGEPAAPPVARPVTIAIMTHELLEPLPTVITSRAVPQVDRLDKVTRIVELVASGAPLSVDTTGLESRHINYHKQAARILHLLSDEGELLPGGATLVRLPPERRFAHLAIQFEVSICGHAWMDWAGVKGVDALEPESAFEFLRQRVKLPDSMVQRRGRSLRRWAKDLGRPAHSTRR